MLDISCRDNQIIFIVDTSGIIRDIKISGGLEKSGLLSRIITKIIDNNFGVFCGLKGDFCTWNDERNNESEDETNQERLEKKDECKDIFFALIGMEMKFFDVKEKKIENTGYFLDISLLDVIDSESDRLKEGSAFCLFCSENRINLFIIQDLFDLFSSPLIIKESVFWINKNLHFSARGDFFECFEYFVETICFCKEEFHYSKDVVLKNKELVKPFSISFDNDTTTKDKDKERKILFDISNGPKERNQSISRIGLKKKADIEDDQQP
jgi:hypothetical protein